MSAMEHQTNLQLMQIKKQMELLAQQANASIDGNLGISVHIAALETARLALAQEEIEENGDRVGDVDRLITITVAAHEGRRRLAKALDGAR